MQGLRVEVIDGPALDPAVPAAEPVLQTRPEHLPVLA